MKLISMLEFVLEQGRLTGYDKNDEDWIEGVLDYANFLNKPLEKCIFVPCDEEGNVLEEPQLDFDGTNQLYYNNYIQAKERILFEGFEFKESKKEGNYDLIRFPAKKITPLYPKLWQGLKIEDLVKYNLTLTATAIKTLGL